MKIKFLPTWNAPDSYSFSADVITANLGELSEAYDLSAMPEGATLTSADKIDGVSAIREAVRTGGELHVTLCQVARSGHWVESGWIDSSSYDPEEVYITEVVNG